MFLVGVAIGFLALGTVVGKDLPQGTALICSFGGLGMLLIASFGGQRFRIGTFAIGWLYALALLIGLGLGPAIAYFTANQPAVLTQAAGGTALTVVGMGALGFALSKDLARWMRPLSILVMIAVGISIVMLVVGAAGSPILSLIIYAVSALLILVNFNYLRKRADENDVVWLATGIFVSIVNIFISLLNLFSSRSEGARRACAGPGACRPDGDRDRCGSSLGDDCQIALIVGLYALSAAAFGRAD